MFDSVPNIYAKEKHTFNYLKNPKILDIENIVLGTWFKDLQAGPIANDKWKI